jgi:hypothetical protein
MLKQSRRAIFLTPKGLVSFVLRRVFSLRSFKRATNHVNRLARRRSNLVHRRISAERSAKRTRVCEHLLHDVNVTRANAFPHGKTLRFELIHKTFDLLVAHNARADDLSNIVEVDTFGFVMTRDKLVEDVRNERAHNASLRTPEAASHPACE